MRSLLKCAAVAARLALRVAAIIALIGAFVFPLLPNGYFALLPLLVAITLWALSDLDLPLPFRRTKLKSDRDKLRAKQ